MDKDKMREEAAAISNIIAARHAERAAAAISKHDLPEEVVRLIMDMAHIIDANYKDYLQRVNSVITLVEVNEQLAANNERLINDFNELEKLFQSYLNKE